MEPARYSPMTGTCSPLPGAGNANWMPNNRTGPTDVQDVAEAVDIAGLTLDLLFSN